MKKKLKNLINLEIFTSHFVQIINFAPRKMIFLGANVYKNSYSSQNNITLLAKTTKN